MITAGDFKKGITVEWDGGVWTIVDFQHVKPGKGAAFVRTKIKNVMTGAVVHWAFAGTGESQYGAENVKDALLPRAFVMVGKTAPNSFPFQAFRMTSWLARVAYALYSQ